MPKHNRKCAKCAKRIPNSARVKKLAWSAEAGGLKRTYSDVLVLRGFQIPDDATCHYVCHRCDLELQRSLTDEGRPTQEAGDEGGGGDVRQNPSAEKKRVKKRQRRRPRTAAERRRRRLDPKLQTDIKLLSIIDHIKRKRYDAAMRILVRQAGASLAKAVTAVVKEELRDLEIPYLSKQTTLDDLDQFDWDQVVKVVEEQCPVYSAGLTAAMGDRCTKARLGFSMCQTIFTRNRTRNFVQGTVGLAMWRAGVPEKVFELLNTVGATLCRRTVTTRVDQLTAEAEKLVQTWKEDYEKEVETVLHRQEAERDQGTTWMETTDYPSSGDSQDSDFAPPALICPEPPLSSVAGSMSSTATTASSTTTIASEPDPGLLLPAQPYSVAVDNVQFMEKPRHYGKEVTYKMHQGAMACVARNRALYRPRTRLAPSTVRTMPGNIPVDEFLPRPKTEEVLRRRMEVLVKRIVVHHLPHFNKHYAGMVEDHIPHRYSAEMAQPSEMRTLPYMATDINTNQGMIHVLERLHRYVPSTTQGLVMLPLLADATTVNRTYSSRRIRRACLTDLEQVASLEPLSMDFHHRGNRMIGYLKELYPVSAAFKGSIRHIQERFGHRNVNLKVMGCFYAAEDLVRFTTEAYVVSKFMDLAGMKMQKDVPKDSPSPATCSSKQEFEEARQKYLDRLARQLVDDVWMLPTQEALHKMVVQATGDVCFCRDDVPKNDELVWCQNDGCPHARCYHLECVGLVGQPEGFWFCSNICSTERKMATGIAESKDTVHAHSRQVTWRGLLELALHDMTREGDGEAVIEFWRVSMLDFIRDNQTTYLTQGYRLLAGIAGVWPEEMAFNATYNRFANVNGGSGHNVPMDQYVEFINNTFKDMLANCHGTYTPDTLDRISRMSGAVGNSLSELTTRRLTDRDLRFSRAKDHDYASDVAVFLRETADEGLFEERVPARSLAGFSPAQLDSNSGKTLRTRLAEYAKDYQRQSNPWFL